MFDPGIPLGCVLLILMAFIVKVDQSFSQLVNQSVSSGQILSVVLFSYF